MSTELIVKNAKVCSYTNDGKKTTFEAIFMKDGKILSVGTNAEICEKREQTQGSSTRKAALLRLGFATPTCTIPDSVQAPIAAS